MKIVNCRNQVIPLPVGDPLKPYESRIIPDDDWLIASKDRMTTAFIDAGIVSVMPVVHAKPKPEHDSEPTKSAPEHKQTWRERFDLPAKTEPDDGDLRG